jgi:hypothetical protein
VVDSQATPRYKIVENPDFAFELMINPINVTYTDDIVKHSFAANFDEPQFL